MLSFFNSPAFKYKNGDWHFTKKVLLDKKMTESLKNTGLLLRKSKIGEENCLINFLLGPIFFNPKLMYKNFVLLLK